MQGVDQCQESQQLVARLWVSGQPACCGEEGKALWETWLADIASMACTMASGEGTLALGQHPQALSPGTTDHLSAL